MAFMKGVVTMASHSSAGQGCQQRERLGEVHDFTIRDGVDSRPKKHHSLEFRKESS